MLVACGLSLAGLDEGMPQLAAGALGIIKFLRKGGNLDTLHLRVAAAPRR